MPYAKIVESQKHRSQEEEVYPNNLTFSEYQEFAVGSCIDPELIALSFFHLEGDEPLEHLFVSDQIPRRNTGQVSHSFLKRYRHVSAGGWWCSGVDVLNKFDDELWGQFKPNKPRLSLDKGKIIKYEAPPKFPTSIFALKLPSSLWDRIARRYGILRYLSPLALRLRDRKHSISFWEWLIDHPEIPLIITEGAKKAAALLSLGYAAIALPGIFNGYRQPKDEFGRITGLAKLIPQLQIFAQTGRKIYLCFDQDNQPKTRQNVNTALFKTGRLFAQAGCEVKIIRWSQPEKGVDDLIRVHGSDAFDHAYNTALSLEAWQARIHTQLTYPANIRVDRRYLDILTGVQGSTEGNISKDNLRSKTDNLKSPFSGSSKLVDNLKSLIQNPLSTETSNTAKLICLKSPKGTGKTHLLEQVVDEAIKQGKWVLLLTHRIQLGEALCQRVGLPYLTEIRKVEFGSVLGYGLCVDSLHPNSSARFNADNWQDGIVIMDEAEQVIWHLLNSDTCTKERVEILSQFKTLIQNTLSGDGQVYLADADLSDIAIDYIRSLAGFHVEPFVIVNDWQPNQDERWTVYNYEDKNPGRLVQDLLQHIEAGGRPMVCCSAQRIQSKWGTQNLESYLQLKFPLHKILRIDSETVADPNHPAYGCIPHLNNILHQYDIVIASSSIETGVSIECERLIVPHSQIPLAFQFLLKGIETSLGKVNKVPHFDSVWAIAQGVQTTDSIRQFLSRIRASVPRYLWAAKRGFYKCMVGNGATTKKALLASTKNKASTNIRFLQAADASLAALDLDTDFQPESLNTWAKRGCYINLTMQNYRTSIVEGLIAEGHQVVAPPPIVDVESPVPQVEAQLKQVATFQYQAECTQIANSPNPTDSEYQKLKDKRAKTREERYKERKGKVVRRYGENVVITPELVAKDHDGWYGKWLSHYYLTVGRPYLVERDVRQLRAISERSASRCAATGKNRLWLPDFNLSLLSTSLRLLETLILGLLQPDVQYRGSDPNLQLIAELALANRREIKNFLGLTIKESDSPIKIAQKLLSLLGLKLTYIGRLGSREQRERVYVFVPPDDGREEIFASWLERDRALATAEETTQAASTSSNLELTSVSTIGKDNNLIPPADTDKVVDTETKKEEQTLPSFISPGAVVEWLRQKGQWIVQATTGIVVKIRDTSGQEFLVKCQELKLCYTE